MPSRGPSTTGRRSLLLAALVLVASAVIPSPVQATHWCPNVDLAVSPSQARAGESIPFRVDLTNRGPEPINVTIQVRLGWEDQAWLWGTMDLGPGAQEANTFTKTVTSVTGDYAVRLFLSGAAADSGEESDFCPTQQRQFRVIPSPEFAVVITARPAGGTAPMAVDFHSDIAGGFGVLNYSWEFGDGSSASGPSVSHTYESPGTYTAQIVATDAIGRLAVDRFVITIATENAAYDDRAIPQPSAALLLVAIAAGAWAFRRPYQRT